MSVSLNSTTNSQSMRLYRVPVHQERTRGYDDIYQFHIFDLLHLTEKYLYLDDVSQHLQHQLYVLLENKMRDSASSISFLPLVSLVKQRQHIVRVATTSTNAGSSTDLIVLLAKKIVAYLLKYPLNLIL